MECLGIFDEQDRWQDYTARKSKRKYLIDCQTDKNVLNLPGNNGRQASYGRPLPDSPSSFSTSGRPVFQVSIGKAESNSRFYGHEMVNRALSSPGISGNRFFLCGLEATPAFTGNRKVCFGICPSFEEVSFEYQLVDPRPDIVLAVVGDHPGYNMTDFTGRRIRHLL
jgi:hypothetical protein